jgi:hypothetical protein
VALHFKWNAVYLLLLPEKKTRSNCVSGWRLGFLIGFWNILQGLQNSLTAGVRNVKSISAMRDTFLIYCITSKEKGTRTLWWGPHRAQCHVCAQWALIECSQTKRIYIFDYCKLCPVLPVVAGYLPSLLYRVVEGSFVTESLRCVKAHRSFTDLLFATLQHRFLLKFGISYICLVISRSVNMHFSL